jgi:predicted RNase H-like HicB family nuclease
MSLESAEIYREGEWFVAFCSEVSEANGQGKTLEECLQSLQEAVYLLMADRHEDVTPPPVL